MCLPRYLLDQSIVCLFPVPFPHLKKNHIHKHKHTHSNWTTNFICLERLFMISELDYYTHTHKWNATNLYTAKKEKFEPSSSSSYCSIQIYFFILFFGSIFSLVNFFFFSPSHNQYIQKEKEKETNSKSINQSISPLSTESMI